MPGKRPEILRGAARPKRCMRPRGRFGNTNDISWFIDRESPAPVGAGKRRQCLDVAPWVPDDRSSAVRPAGIADYLSAKVDAEGSATVVAGNWCELNTGSPSAG